VWTQDPVESKKIAKASKISQIVDSPEDMLEAVDAVIIARDDYQSHRELALPFLKNGKYVFIDKPLSLAREDLIYFYPYLQSGKLMSCSGIRYAPELDRMKDERERIGKVKLIRGTVCKSWEKYAIHMLEGIFSVMPFSVLSVRYQPGLHESFALLCEDGSIVQIDALGTSSPLLRIEFYGDYGCYRADTLDAFTAFRRTLYHFVTMVQNESVPVLPDETIYLMRILMAGLIASKENREVTLDSITI